MVRIELIRLSCLALQASTSDAIMYSTITKAMNKLERQVKRLNKVVRRPGQESTFKQCLHSAQLLYSTVSSVIEDIRSSTLDSDVYSRLPVLSEPAPSEKVRTWIASNTIVEAGNPDPTVLDGIEHDSLHSNQSMGEVPQGTSEDSGYRSNAHFSGGSRQTTTASLVLDLEKKINIASDFLVEGKILEAEGTMHAVLSSY